MTWDLRPENHPKSLACNRSHSKNTTKYISHGYISQDTLLSPPTYFWVRKVVFPFSSKISYAHLLNGMIPRKKCKTASHVLLQRTNNTNKIYDVQTMQTKSRDFAKTVMIIKLGPRKIWKNRPACSAAALNCVCMTICR